MAAVWVLVVSVPAEAFHSWNGYHWARTGNPLDLKVVDSTTGTWSSKMATALGQWAEMPLAHDWVFSSLTVVRTDDSTRARKLCRTVSGQMRVCNAAYGFNGWLGLASINLDSSGHITRGVALMNDSYASYWSDWDGEMSHVMCQEIGHVLGLGHTSENGSYDGTCMDYSRPPSNPDSQSPYDHDFEELAAMYLHLDAYDSYDSGASGGGDNTDPKPCRGRKCAGFEEPEVPPMGIRVHRGESHEIWVARGRDDTLWIHHVTLAPEEYQP
jgi:hypothetical protein